MSANKYSITIINQTNVVQEYLLFQTTPEVNPEPSTPVFTNVYQKSGEIPPGAIAKFHLSIQWNAVNGTSPTALNPGVSVDTVQPQAVTLGSGATPGTTLSLTTISGGEGPEFNPSAVSAAAPKGSYQIVTDGSFKYPNEGHIFIGLGAPSPDGSGLIQPTATLTALPSRTYTIWPHNQWYICTGSFTPGVIIDVEDIGITQIVDFETGLPDQTFTNGPNGQYTPDA